MNKKSIKKNISLLMSLLLILTFVSCTKTDKETVLSPNVSANIKSEENEVKLTLEKGHNFLNDNDFESAKSTYEKAISMDKTNKDIYLEIKDKYIAINRFDDALYFIQLSINNSTDIDNMKVISDNIKSNFKTDPFIKNLYEGDNFILPSELTAKVNNEDISIPITWNNSSVDTSTSGTFYFVGTNKEYNREFNATLTVLPNVISEEIGNIKNVYKSNGKIYVDVDLVEFFKDDIALAEAIKDNNFYINDAGLPAMAQPFYIRDKYNTITTYELSDNTTFNLLPSDIDPYSSLPALTLIPFTYDKFESFTNKINDSLKESNNKYATGTLCWINFKNGIVYDISRQYTP